MSAHLIIMFSVFCLIFWWIGYTIVTPKRESRPSIKQRRRNTMKKLQRALSVFAMMLTACLTLPSMAQAAETTKSIGDNLSLLYCIPFAGILLCIAICPFVAGEWW